MRFYNINFLKLCSFIPPDLLTSIPVTFFTKFGGKGQSLLASKWSFQLYISFLICPHSLPSWGHHQYPSTQPRNFMFILDSSHDPFVIAHQVLLIPPNYLSNLSPSYCWNLYHLYSRPLYSTNDETSILILIISSLIILVHTQFCLILLYFSPSLAFLSCKSW